MEVSNIAVFGSSGSLGNAFIKHFAVQYPKAVIYAFSRSEQAFDNANVLSHSLDFQDEGAIEQAVIAATVEQQFDLVIVATGILHDEIVTPEKSLKQLSINVFRHYYDVDTILPAMIAKYCLPRLNRDNQALFAVLSARVGSISDNQLGGWYGYRMAKAALNMFIKTAAIEIKRSNKQAVVVGLHPGTVNSPLSTPFQCHVPEGKLFSPDYAAQQLVSVLTQLSPEQSGACFAYDGQEIAP
jgi:NAD(P)-dependent dehydrogenase (short-subunit alcohol dehydrogenase family)